MTKDEIYKEIQKLQAEAQNLETNCCDLKFGIEQLGEDVAEGIEDDLCDDDLGKNV